MQNLHRNLEVVLGRPPTDAELETALASYARYGQEFLASFSHRHASRQLANVRVIEHGSIQPVQPGGRGAVVVLPHMGNWDLAGAWAAAHGISVVTVVERIRPRWLFDLYLARRTRAGLTIMAHDEPLKLGRLGAHLEAGGLVGLVADRYFGGGSATAEIAGEAVTLPTGPILLARRFRVPLLPVGLQFEPDGMVVHLGERIEVASVPRQEAVQAMADGLAWAIQLAPLDWHMLQPLFNPPAQGRDGAGDEWR
jgi:KDO2-lipid IV(A) lauroyltransferase